MFKSKIRQFVLNHALTREVFFWVCGKKANLRKVDRALANGDIHLSNVSADNVIVSLTSYGERIKELKYTLYSLVVQSVRPDKIVVNLAFEDEKYVTEELKSFEKYGVEFFFCKNLRSHTKLVPTLKRFPNSNIVTADDDIYYAKDWLKRLYDDHKQYPNDVCCHYIRTVSYNNCKINSYHHWIPHYKFEPCCSAKSKNSLLGAWGVLYPPDSFYKDVYNEEVFLKLCPLADDIWFYFMVIFSGKKIRQIQNPMTKLCFVNPYREYGINGGVTLTQQNVIGSKNDIQIKNVLSHYEVSDSTFINFIEGKIDNCL